MTFVAGETWRDPFSQTLVLLVERRPSDQDGRPGWLVRTESGASDWFSEDALTTHFRREAAPSPTKGAQDA